MRKQCVYTCTWCSLSAPPAFEYLSACKATERPDSKTVLIIKILCNLFTWSYGVMYWSSITYQKGSLRCLPVLNVYFCHSRGHESMVHRMLWSGGSPSAENDHSSWSITLSLPRQGGGCRSCLYNKWRGEGIAWKNLSWMVTRWVVW